MATSEILPNGQDKFKVPDLKDAWKDSGFVKLKFIDGTEGRLAYEWLRDNCRCEQCYDFTSLSRNFTLDDLQDDLCPQELSVQEGLLKIVWNDPQSHQSVYEKEWLYIRGFISNGRDIYEGFRHLKREVWGSNSKLGVFEFKDVLEEEKVLLEFLTKLEKCGVALVKNSPAESGTAAKLIGKIGHKRLTHFGRARTVTQMESHRYISYTTGSLGLHTDLTYYEDSPGIIFVHAVKQHDGIGGDSIITDGLQCAEIMKEKHPEEFKLLSSVEGYYWDRFIPELKASDSRFKMNKAPIFRIGDKGEIKQITFNNQKRDTNLEMDDSQINQYYKALKIFLNIIYDNILTYKLQTGEMMVLDNTRFLHGRNAYEWPSDRKLEVDFMDWDEARSRRRLLQEKIFQCQPIFQ